MKDMKKKITVTKWDIDNGRPGSPISCPIALACRRAKIMSPNVFCREVIYGKGRSREFQLPKKARSFICRFDEGLSVKPFSFTVLL